MLQKQTVNQLNSNTKEREIVIHAQNLGVSYISGFRADDYKSYMFDYLLGKKHDQEKKKVWPLRNLNFKGYKGEILGIIGPNGSGKTTLCKLIAGILQPEEGNIKVDGKVSALFSFGLGVNKELTGRENVYMSGMMVGVPKQKITKFIDEIHEFSELNEFFDMPVKKYSSGMRARLGFSVASYLEPEILVLDEALNTGDMSFGKKAAKRMRELVSRAKMVVIVSHSLSYIEKNCDRVIWLDKGVIKAEGSPSEIVNLYRESVPVKKKKKNRKKVKLEIQKTELKLRDNIVVNAENLGVAYKLKKKNDFWALKDVSFQIKEGEVVGIIGHNGAGKSTLCKVLTRILTPDKGRLHVNGNTTALLGFGGGFNVQLSGRDNIFLNGMLLGIPKNIITQRFDEIVQFSGLEKVIDKPVKQYSSGMRSRLGFSIAASLQPDIFIIDEALSAGDMAFSQKASEKIQEMIEKAKAVIVVSHSMSFVERVCTRAIHIKQGEILYDGNPTEAIMNYKMSLNDKKG